MRVLLAGGWKKTRVGNMETGPAHFGGTGISILRYPGTTCIGSLPGGFGHRV